MQRLALVGLILALSPSVSVAAMQTCVTERVSLGVGGVQASGPYSIQYTASMSSDARYVVWASSASNLVPNDTNPELDVFLRDRLMQTTELISVDSAGAQHPGWSGTLGTDVSPDGRWVVFDSGSQLSPLDPVPNTPDIYRRDRLTGTTDLVSVSLLQVASSDLDRYVSVSADGRYVLFGSWASDLVPNDTTGSFDWFVRDMTNAVTECVSVDSNGNFGHVESSPFSVDYYDCAISADGRFVCFNTRSSGLDPLDPSPNVTMDLFVRDRQLGITRLVSTTAGGAHGPMDVESLSMSANGARVAFYARGDFGFGNLGGAVYVRDLTTGTFQVASQSTGGATSFMSNRFVDLSFDGRYVTFDSTNPGLVLGDTDTVYDVYVRDTLAGTTARVSDAGASGPYDAFAREISADGRSVLFMSYSSQGVAADTNGLHDVFLQTCASPYTVQCMGDSTLCPCAQGGTPGGCGNSIGTGGRIGADGNASLTADTFRLLGESMPNGPTLYFQFDAASAPAAAPFGDGLLCYVGAIARLGVVFNQGGASSYPTAPPSISVQTAILAPAIRRYQAWYRDAAPFCTSSTFNLTNGISVQWMP